MKTLYVKLLLVLGLQMFSLSSYAVPGTITLQTKILQPNGSALDAAAVNFRITTLDPLSTCVLFIENFNNVNMINSGGVVISNLGAGIQVYTSSGSYNSIFDNAGTSYTCQSGGTYTPAATDSRKIVMQFNDGSSAGWQTLQAIDINSVPFSFYAGDSTKFSGRVVADFALKADFPDCNTTGKVLTFNGTAFTCVAAGTAGAITAATALVGDVTGTVGATVVSTVGTKTAAQIAQSVTDTVAATAANTVSTIVKRDGSGNISTTSVSATNFSAQNTYLYDGANSSRVLLKAPAAGVTDYTMTLPPTIGSANQILGYNNAGTALENKSITAGAGVSVTHSAGGIQIAATGGGGAGNVLTTNCGAGSAPKFSVALDAWTCVAIGSLDAAAISTGTIAAARLPASAKFWNDAGSGKITYVGGPVGIGVTSPTVPLEISASTGGSIFRAFADGGGLDISSQTLPGAEVQTAIMLTGGGTGSPFPVVIAASGNQFVLQTGVHTAMTASLDTGQIGIGADPSPDLSEQLTVGGNINHSGQAYSNQNIVAPGTNVDFNTGNLQIIETIATTTVPLTNMKYGASYVVIITDTTARTYTFSGCAQSKFSPANTETIANTSTIYNILPVSLGGVTVCFISWSTGYQ